MTTYHINPENIESVRKGLAEKMNRGRASLYHIHVLNKAIECLDEARVTTNMAQFDSAINRAQAWLSKLQAQQH